jgi:hypothetical protein
MKIGRRLSVKVMEEGAEVQCLALNIGRYNTKFANTCKKLLPDESIGTITSSAIKLILYKLSLLIKYANRELDSWKSQSV